MVLVASSQGASLHAHLFQLSGHKDYLSGSSPGCSPPVCHASVTLGDNPWSLWVHALVPIFCQPTARTAHLLTLRPVLCQPGLFRLLLATSYQGKSTVSIPVLTFLPFTLIIFFATNSPHLPPVFFFITFSCFPLG